MKEFLTLFSINGAIKPGFKTAFGGAKKDVASLGKTVDDTTKKIGGLTKTVIGLGAAYLGYKGLSHLFGEAARNSSKASDASFRLLQTLKNQKQLQAAGTANYQNQFNILQQQTKELAKIGVFTSTSYATAQRQLAAYGLMPKQIAQITQKIGDVTVAQHGASASMEDMEESARKVGEWITKGNIKALGPMGALLTQNQKELAKQVSEAERLEWWLELATKSARNFNKEAGDTAPVQRFRKEWEEFSKEMGDRLKPARNAIAQFKSEALVALGPEFKRIIDEDVNPAVKSFTDFLAKDGVKAVSDFSQSFRSDVYPAIRDLATEFGTIFSEINKAFGKDSQGEVQSFGKMIGERLAGHIRETTRDIERLREVLKKLMDGWTELTKIGSGTPRYSGPPVSYARTVGAAPGQAPSIAQAMQHMARAPVTAGQREAMRERAAAAEEIAPKAMTAVEAGGGTLESAREAVRANAAALGSGAKGYNKAWDPYLESVARSRGLNPNLLKAIARQENVRPGIYNPLGLSHVWGVKKFSEVEAAMQNIERQADLIKNPKGPYKDFARTGRIEDLAKIYSPIGAKNDIYGTNKYEASGIVKNLRRLEAEAGREWTGSGFATTATAGTPSLASSSEASAVMAAAADLRALGAEFAKAAEEEKLQRGGLVSSPTHALIGEGGPEMVVPLERSRRGLSLLETAARSMGINVPGWASGAMEGLGGEVGAATQLGRAMEELFSRIRGSPASGAGRTSGPMNYAPTLNFGSGAEPGMVTLARNMLRSTAGEFFDRYEEAFDEGRRLAFE